MDRKKETKAMSCVKEPELEHGSFYDRIKRAGYGPPDGIKLDRAGWRRHFHDMQPDLRYHIIRNFFSDVLPEGWSPLKIRLEWLDGVDKDVTSRSPAFACCPRYQYIWQNGYGPEGGHELHIEDWEKFEAKMNEDQRKEMKNDLFDMPDGPAHGAKLWKIYTEQIRESEGFDVDVHVRGECGTIRPMFDDMSQAKKDDRLINYSRKALDEYNQREGTDYTVTEVVNACMQGVVGFMYYITFQGRNSEGHIQDFQAKVHQHPKASEEIVLFRPKIMDSSLSFYNRIINSGYGPPEGGHNLGKAGWRKYFDEMPLGKQYNLMRNVLADVLPKEWHPEQIKVYYLYGVDKNVTSRSPMFAYCPNYQYMWQNGYDPPDGENLDIEAWRKYLDEMPKDEKSIMRNDLFTIPKDPAHDANLWETYMNQLRQSEGFDVDVDVRGGYGIIRPMFCDMSQAKNDDKLIYYSIEALNAYNDQEGTDYTVNEVVKACVQGVLGQMYYITFKAKNSEGHIQVFQAKVHQHQRRQRRLY